MSVGLMKSEKSYALPSLTQPVFRLAKKVKKNAQLDLVGAKGVSSIR